MFSTPLIQLHAVHVKVFSLQQKNSRKKIPKSGHRENTTKSALHIFLSSRNHNGSPRVLKNSLIYAILVLLHVAPYNELMH